MRKYVPTGGERKRKYARWMKRRVLKLINAKEKQWKKCKDRLSYENQVRYKKKRSNLCSEVKKN
jgi:hypothetical protein